MDVSTQTVCWQFKLRQPVTSFPKHLKMPAASHFLTGLHLPKKVTAANTEPIAPRDKQRVGCAAETTSARQVTNQLLNELDEGVQAGQKRKACRSIDVPAHEEKKEHPEAEVEVEQEQPRKVQIKREDAFE